MLFSIQYPKELNGILLILQKLLFLLSLNKYEFLKKKCAYTITFLSLPPLCPPPCFQALTGGR